MTAHQSPPKAHQFFALGADDYVFTHTPAPIILTRIERHLERYALLHRGLQTSRQPN
ncbi:MAG: hypothetical protein F6K09_18845 [Merismopedia sp. SIO2A8]|nr:hypothetical protein [Merismopedia sp. SIO2A8]